MYKTGSIKSAENRKAEFIQGSINKVLQFYALHFPNQFGKAFKKDDPDNLRKAAPIFQLLNYKKMRTLYLLGACVLLSTTLFSCTADEFETEAKKTEIKKEVIPTNETQATGPDDDPMPTTPPPPKK